MKKKKLVAFVLILSISPLALGSCCFFPFPYWDYDDEHGYHRHQHQEHHGHEGGGRRGEGGDQKIEKVKEEVPAKEQK
jgi:hypothetical protein